MKRWFSRLGIALGTLILVATLAAAAFVFSFRSSVPNYDGARVVSGLTAPARILRDRYGIPYIQAQTAQDAAFALGYAHAQDRLWQMETSRRFVAGRLAELFGTLALNSDISMRSLGLYRAAEQAVDYLSPQARSVLNAYAAGVNAYLAQHQEWLPIEFALTGDTPEPWRPADSIAVLKAMSFQLSGNVYEELARAELLATLGRIGVENFFPPFSAVPLPPYLDRLYGTTIFGNIKSVPDITASNNWVVDGKHSVTGKPLLANDPHLGFSIPIVWYLATLSYAEGNEETAIAGATLAGVPAIIAGHNRHVAWGLTNTGPDTEDLYLEQIDPADPTRYRTPSGWATVATRHETVKVRFGADRVILVRETRHGPILTDANSTQGVLGARAPAGYALALAWTGLAPDDTTFDAVLGINAARSAEEVRGAAISFYVTPMQNLVYADDGGHIGLVLPGRVPMRGPSNDSRGLVPEPGWDRRYDWTGYVPQAASIVDPPSGRIATANNKTPPASYPYTLTYEWDPPYRHDRIDALLATTPLHSLASFRAMQLDTTDTYALMLKQYVNPAEYQGVYRQAASMLAAWNGDMNKDRPEPLIFAAFARALARRIYADELGNNFQRFWGYRPEFTLRVLANVDGAGRWCDDKASAAVEDCPSRIRLALHDAVQELSTLYGMDPARWRWGDPHKAEFANATLGIVPLIGGLANRAVDTDGGPFTLRRADNSMADKRPYAALHGAGYRGIYDLADPDASLFIIATGESGNAYSPHYDDLLPLWARGDYITLPARPSAPANSLTLQPASRFKAAYSPRQ